MSYGNGNFAALADDDFKTEDRQKNSDGVDQYSFPVQNIVELFVDANPS